MLHLASALPVRATVVSNPTPIAAVCLDTPIHVARSAKGKKRPLDANSTKAPKQQKNSAYICEHCGQSGDHLGNHKRHVLTVHKVGVRCPLCYTLFYDRQAYIEHIDTAVVLAPSAAKGLPLCTAVNWTTFRTDPTATPPSEAEINKMLEDFEVWLREEPVPAEDGIKNKAHDKPATIQRIVGDLRLLTRAAHNKFPGIFRDGVRLSVIVEHKVVSHLITEYGQRPGFISHATIKESRMSDVLGALKKAIAYLARRVHQDTRRSIEFSDVGAWDLVRADSKNTKGSILAQRDYKQSPAGLEEDKILGRSITAEDLFHVARECRRLMSAIEEKPASNTRIVRCAYRRLLVTALVVYCLAPRSQCIKLLTLQSHFERGKTGIYDQSVYPPGHRLNVAENRYLFQIPAAYQKHKQTWFVWLPEHMTGHVNYWRQTFGKETDAWLILNENGKQLQSVGQLTKQVTEQIIRRAITAHRFRHCLTTFFKNQGLPEQENRYMRVFRQNTERTAESIYAQLNEALPHLTKFQAMMI